MKALLAASAPQVLGDVHRRGGPAGARAAENTCTAGADGLERQGTRLVLATGGSGVGTAVGFVPEIELGIDARV